MKSIEIRHVNIGSTLKAILFTSVFPLIAILLVLGLQFAVTGISSTAEPVSDLQARIYTGGLPLVDPPGESLTQFALFLLPILLYALFFFGIILLCLLSYNMLAGRFGGLVVRVRDKDAG